jgi:hypothetical protein
MSIFEFGSRTKSLVHDTPQIKVKERLKKVEISGQSRMADPAEFYQKLQVQLENYFVDFKRTLILDIRFEYINSGSSKWLYLLLKHMQQIAEKDGLIEINWYYEDDDEVILEAGEVLQSLLKIPLHMKEVL